MLGLKRNKRGFTLVELIVVIAIMAVLAGTVAGVTVSQLNKQTDKTKQNQAKEIADTIYREMMDRAVSSAKDKDNKDLDKITDEKLEIEEYITEVLASNYGENGKVYNAGYEPNSENKGNKGKIFVFRASGADGNAQYCVKYFGKQSGGKGDISYSIDLIYGIRENAQLAQANQSGGGNI